MSSEATLATTAAAETTAKTSRTKSRRLTRQTAPPPDQTALSAELSAELSADEAGAAEAISGLPEEILAFLVRSAPPRDVWAWLNAEERRPLMHKLTRGFQRTANTLRQTVVRSRLVHHLQSDHAAWQALLSLWGEATPPPKAVSEVRALNDEALLEQLPALWHWLGPEPLLLALLLDNRRAALDALDTLAEQELAAEEESDTQPRDSAEEGDQPQSLPDIKPERRKLSRRRDDALQSEELASVTDELATAQAQIAEWRQRAERAEAVLAAGQTEHTAALAALREQGQAEARSLNLQLKQEQHRAAATQEKLKETKHLLDRTARRLKNAEKEATELTTENKRLKRQLRSQQQHGEELRKQLASATTKLQQLIETQKLRESMPDGEDEKAVKSSKRVKPAVDGAAATVPVSRPPAAPQDQIFAWKADGRQFRVTPREVKRAIDANDEEFVFTLIQALDALRETNEPGYRQFIDRMREFNRYYSRVLTTDTTRVLVDASNVARYETDRYGKGQLRHLLAMRDELRRRGCFPIHIYADASLRYHIDEPDELVAMAKRGEIEITPAGQEADEFLAREARRTGAYVVTNDRSFYLKVSPDYEPPRITFRIYDGFLVVDDF
ncbi:MAG: hypothetical protein M3347_00365 [Armatimonadota bacterium]|nr:hypothetical protein [Armatimonadota bacterium]